MDEYDERLVSWFDYDFRPSLGKELADAFNMMMDCEIAREYWQGYYAALGMVNSLVNEGLVRIRREVEGDCYEEEERCHDD